MRITSVVPLTLAALLIGCQDGNDSNTDPLAPAIPPSSEVIRTRIEGGFLFHGIPEHGITLTVGLLTPIEDLEECGGTVTPIETETDAQIFNQEEHTPAGPIKLIDRFTGTFTVYEGFLFPDLCALATAPVIGTDRG